jgi:Fic family protein
MGALELFLHDQPVRIPALLKAALAHVQFETIHPFLDGNGRIGRLLITLILCVERVLREPLLYLSLYFKRHRQEYYERLQRVRTDGEWLEWLRFFLVGVEETARQAAATVRLVFDRLDADRAKIAEVGRPSVSAAQLHGLLQRKPVISVPSAAKELGLSAPTVRAAVERLERLGLLREITGKRRDRLYLYEPYLRILEEGTAPL